MDRTAYILELERKHHQQMLDSKLKQAKHKTHESMVNLGVFIISEQMKASTMVLFAGLNKEDI